MKILTLLLAGIALAAPAKKLKKKPAAASVWSLSFPGGYPTAACFDANTGALFVSVKDAKAERGRIAKVSLEGKLLNATFARSKGAPGPLRSSNGRLYWISGADVESQGKEGTLLEGSVPKELGEATDIAVTGNGTIYLGMSGGSLAHIMKGASASVDFKALPITGLLLLQDTLHVLRGRRLESVTLSAERDLEQTGLTICLDYCHGLERTSSGDWLTVSGGSVRAVNGRGVSRTLLELPAKTEIGRPAYVSRPNAGDDFYVLPLPALGEIRAYRAGSASPVAFGRR